MNNTFETIIDNISEVVLGKRVEIERALTCLFAGGHLLIEDLPGIGKTTLAKVMARCLGLTFKRIQCTSDMLPGDILGVSIYDPKLANFTFHQGPVFTQVLLADEINRAPSKTQSALLEAMEERQVTIEGNTYPLDNPFFVVATQNPLEQAGTFPLPESQLDRFLMRIRIGYPGRQAEHELLKRGEQRLAIDTIKDCVEPGQVHEIQENIRKVHVAAALINYIQDLLDFSRNSSHFLIGLSPRAGISILDAARARAYIQDRDHILPEDVQDVLPWVVSHRLRSADDYSEIPHEKLMGIFEEVPIP